MAEESRTTPGTPVCVHEWAKVEGAIGASGGMVVACKKCSVTRELDPPVAEARRDSRPLLTE